MIHAPLGGTGGGTGIRPGSAARNAWYWSSMDHVPAFAWPIGPPLPVGSPVISGVAIAVGTDCVEVVGVVVVGGGSEVGGVVISAHVFRFCVVVFKVNIYLDGVAAHGNRDSPGIGCWRHRGSAYGSRDGSLYWRLRGNGRRRFYGHRGNRGGRLHRSTLVRACRGRWSA